MILAGTRVVEFASSTAASYCGKVLAELGADVVKVEPPAFGDPSRFYGPFIGPHADGERSASFTYLNAGKRSVTLDWHKPGGEALAALLAESAGIVLVDNDDPVGLSSGWQGIVAKFSGSGHPMRRSYVVSELVGYALGGYLYTDGAADREPLKGGGDQPGHTAGNYAIMAILACFFQAARGRKRRCELEVPEVECMATMHWYTTVMWSYAHIKKQRIGNRLDITHPVSLYPCSDGWVAIGAGGDAAWQLLAAAIGRPDLIDDPRYANGALRLERADEVDEYIRAYTLSRTRDEVMRSLQELRIPCGKVSTAHDLLEDPQYTARSYWNTVTTFDGQAYRVPGHPFVAEGLPFCAVNAPRLGEHTGDVLDQLGVTPAQQRAFRGAHVI